MKSLTAIFRRVWRKTHVTQLILLTLSIIVLLALLYFAYHAFTANVQSLQDGLTKETVIYDKDGEVASEISMRSGDQITIDDIPPHVRHAVIAIEDHRFYDHSGFDLKGIARSALKNLFAGRITSGGSTITQQLTKNALLSPERTYKRKIEELFLAVEIEKHYEKDDILFMYLNQVYFGNNAWGIDRAAQRYFSKTPAELTVSEGALLAGVLKAPSALDPTKNMAASVERRNVVLMQMKENNFISAEQYKKAVTEEIVLEQGRSHLHVSNYPYYVDAVLDEAINLYGLSQEEIFLRGYQIHTALDQQIQASIEKVYENNALFPKSKTETIVESGSVLLDPATGGVRGLVGGRGERVFRGFNRATHLRAQPGSTLKPLAVYVPALEDGYRPSSLLKDEKIVFDTYAPENISKTYQGEVSLYEAVEQSLNLPTVWLLNEIGLDKGMHALERFGIPLEAEDEYLGIALGGMHKGISPLTLAEAYATFPNEGKRPTGHLITKIVGPTGGTIATFKKETVRVTTKEVADDMTAMLLNVVETGTGQAASIPQVALAGKTGSTQLPYKDLNGTKDQWFVGYTGNLVGATWLGYDRTDRDNYLTSRTSDTVVPIFKAMMEGALEHVDDLPLATVSINDRLAGVEVEEAVKEQATEPSVLKETGDKIKKTVQSVLTSEKWKEGLSDGVEVVEQIGQRIKDNFKKIFE